MKSSRAKAPRPDFEGEKKTAGEDLILDPETFSEQMIVGVGLALTVMSACYAISSLKDNAAASELWFRIVASVGPPLLVTYLLRRWISQDYLVMAKERRIVLRTRAFGRLFVRRVASFDQVIMVAVQPQRNSGKGGVSWSYGLALVLKSGKILKVISPGDQTFDEVRKLGRDTANLLGVSFERGEQEQLMHLRKGDGTVAVY